MNWLVFPNVSIVSKRMICSTHAIVLLSKPFYYLGCHLVIPVVNFMLLLTRCFMYTSRFTYTYNFSLYFHFSLFFSFALNFLLVSCIFLSTFAIIFPFHISTHTHNSSIPYIVRSLLFGCNSNVALVFFVIFIFILLGISWESTLAQPSRWWNVCHRSYEVIFYRTHYFVLNVWIVW